MYKNIEIVVARYNEDLQWIQEYPFDKFKYIIYNKGINSDYKKPKVYREVMLPNVGKCDHTYLYHIVNNFATLSDITMFFPGSLDMQYKKEIATKIITNILLYNSAIFIGNQFPSVKNMFADFTLDNWKTSNTQNSTINDESVLERAKLRPYGRWYKYFFGNKNVKIVCMFGIFSIHKLDIIKHNINYYIQLLNTVSGHSNPEVGHYIERSWGVIFHPFVATKFIQS
jgi:hypothetical protein